MGKEMIRNKLKIDILNNISQFLDSHYDADIMPIAASEITMPCVDENGEECFAVISVKIPRGKREKGKGYIPFDGYAAADEYKADCEAKQEEKRIKEDNKKRAEEFKERKRRARATVRKLNQVGLDKMIHEDT